MNSSGIPIRDSQTGKIIFYLDARTAETPKDVNGKPSGAVKGDPDISRTKAAAALMRGRDLAIDEHGKLVLMDLDPGSVVSPTANRANFVTTANDFIADLVCPVKFIDHDRGFYLYESPDDSLSQNTGGGAAGAAVQTADVVLNKAPFLTTEYGFGARIPSEVVENADFDLKTAALRRAVLASRLAREIRVAALLTTAANWSAANQVTVPATHQWNGGAAANPLGDLFAARATSFLPPTSLVMSEGVEQYWYANANSTRVRDAVQAGIVLPKVIVGRARTLVSGVPSYVWSPSTPASAVLLRDPADPKKTDIGTARTLRWLGHSPDSVEMDGICVREYEHRNFHYLIVIHNDAEIMLQAPSVIGALITGVLQ